MKQASVKKFSPWRIYAGGAVVCAALSAVAYGVGVRPATRRHAEQVASHTELHNARQKLDRDVREQVLAKFGSDFVFNTTIPRLVAVGEATAQLQAVVESQPDSQATFAFHKLVKELIDVLVEEGLMNEQEITRSNKG